jgi:hypothetical protein
MKTLPRSTRQGFAERSTDAQGEGLGGPSRTACPADQDQFSVQTVIVFMPVLASLLVLNPPLSTIVVVVVCFLSTMVHFLVAAHDIVFGSHSGLRKSRSGGKRNDCA